MSPRKSLNWMILIASTVTISLGVGEELRKSEVGRSKLEEPAPSLCFKVENFKLISLDLESLSLKFSKSLNLLKVEMEGSRKSSLFS